MKIDRKKIHKMFGGKCAYCGCDLKDETGKNMQIDHVEPIRRNWYDTGCLFPELDKEDNLFPSCLRCNNYKGGMKLEHFRDFLKTTLQRLEKNNTNYRNALRFGMIEEKKWDGKFYFEKINNNN